VRKDSCFTVVSLIIVHLNRLNPPQVFQLVILSQFKSFWLANRTLWIVHWRLHQFMTVL